MLTILIVAMIAAGLISLAVTPGVRRAAMRLDLIDHPDMHRKLHRGPIPLGGGVSILIAMLTTLLVVPQLLAFDDPRLAVPITDLLPLAAAGISIVAVGLVDDRFHLRGRQKLAGQLLAAACLVAGGLVVRSLHLFSLDIELGILAVPFTIFWLVGAINALNLIDGVDGLATSVGMVLSATIGAMALMNGHYFSALVACTLAGSLAGFLRFNFPPAKMFLGDSGSMLIGLTLGAMAVRSSLKGPATVALAAPIAVWAIPILDSAAAIVRRKLTGRSVYATDRGHLHHCLMAKFGSSRRTLAWIVACCVVTSAGALATVHGNSDLYAVLSIGAVTSVLLTTRLFGHVEARLLANSLKTTSLALLDPRNRVKSPTDSIRWQGSADWDLLLNSLVEMADKFNLCRVWLDVHMPAAQEGYRGSWQRPSCARQDELWRTDLPLLCGDRPIGRLTIEGEHGGLSVCQLIELLMGVVQPFEERLAAIAAKNPGERPLSQEHSVQPSVASAPRVAASA